MGCRGVGETVRQRWGNEGEWGKCDLKTGQKRPSSSAFDLTKVRSTALVPGASGARLFAFELTG
jgi:hypothetical protein